MSNKKYHDPLSESEVSQIWTNGYISGFELVKIAAWKSAISAAGVTVNGEDFIVDRTRNAMQVIQDFQEINVLELPTLLKDGIWTSAVRNAIGSKDSKTGLLGLDGVGYPMATAILCTLLPKVFPVLDRYAIAEVFGVSPYDAQKTKCHTADQYTQFAIRLLEDSRLDSEPTIHLRDQVAMRHGMIKFKK
jgi:hypothetical protein